MRSDVTISVNVNILLFLCFMSRNVVEDRDTVHRNISERFRTVSAPTSYIIQMHNTVQYRALFSVCANLRSDEF